MISGDPNPLHIRRDIDVVPLPILFIEEKNSQFVKVSKIQQNAFVGHRLGSYFGDVELEFVSSLKIKNDEDDLKEQNEIPKKKRRIE